MKKSQIKRFIGIDVSKETLDIFTKSFTQTEGKFFRIENSLPALIALEKRLKRKSIYFDRGTAVVFEHTGIYGKVLLDFFSKREVEIFVESGLRISKSMGIQRGKTDKVDARRITEFGIRHYDKLKPWKPRRPAIVLLKYLLSYQERLKKYKSYFSVRATEFKKFGSPKITKQLNRVNTFAITGVEKSLIEIQNRIDELTASDNRLLHLIELLTSIPQIGKITALNLIVSTNEFKLHTDSRTLACYCGVAPFEYQSGTSIKKRSHIHPYANKKIKNLLHLAALRSISSRGLFRKYYDRKTKEGKHSLSVLNAIRNKFVRRIAAIIERDSPYLKERDYNKTMRTATH